MDHASVETIRDHKMRPIGFISRQLMTFDEVVDMYGDRFSGWFRARHTGPIRGYYGLSEWKKQQEDEENGKACPIHRDLASFN